MVPVISHFIDQEKSVKIIFKILKVKQRPKCQPRSNLMFVAFNKEENKCFNIGEMFEKDISLLSRGKSTKGRSDTASDKRPTKKICDMDSPEESLAKSGLAITKASNGFKYKCSGDNELIDLVIPEGKAIPLFRDCCLKFEAPERSARSTPKLAEAIHFSARAFDGTSEQIQNKVAFDIALFKADESFSEHDIASEVLRESCGNILGETCGERELPCPEGQVKDSKSQLIFYFRSSTLIIRYPN